MEIRRNAARLGLLVALACGKTENAPGDGGACVPLDAGGVKPIVLAGKNPYWLAKSPDETRVFTTVSGNLGASEADAGVESVSVSTKQSLGIAPTETSLTGMTVGALQAFAIASATKAYVVAGGTDYSTYALYKWNPTTGGSAQKLALEPAHEGCYINEVAAWTSGSRVFATCTKTVDGGTTQGVLSLDTTIDTEVAGEWRTTPNSPQSLAVHVADGGTLLVAMTDYSVGTLGKIPLSPSVGALSINSGQSDALGKDPLVRVVESGGATHVVAINRQGMGQGGSVNNLQFLDPANGYATKTGKQFSTGTGSNPNDVALGSSATEIWVTLYAATSNQLIAMNTDTGVISKSIDLSAFATCGNLPRPSMMVPVAGRIWIALQDMDVAYQNQGQGKIVILNPSTGAIESAP